MGDLVDTARGTWMAWITILLISTCASGKRSRHVLRAHVDMLHASDSSPHGAEDGIPGSFFEIVKARTGQGLFYLSVCKGSPSILRLQASGIYGQATSLEN
ncbi:hypothetical protein F4810DRAFT_708047 [Camillea tinctor]|nr:hypothetical protein F4810DRAFT_708047 [Camillea tinctor]